MNAILSYIFESLISGAIIFLLLKYLFTRVQNYQFYRIAMLLSFTAVSIFPLIDISVSNPAISGYILDPLYIINGEATLSNSVYTDMSLSIISLIAFTLVGLLFLLRVIIQLQKLFELKSGGELFEKSNECSVYLSDKISSPLSFGKWIFIPDNFSANERYITICHEKSHIRRGHTIDLIFSSLILTVQWFNPFLHILKKKLAEVHEFQADFDVLSSGTDITEYRVLLLSSQVGRIPEISNSLHKSLTLKRFLKMENLTQSKVRVGVVALLSVAILTLFSISSFSKGETLLADITQLQDTSKTLSFEKADIKPKFQGGDESTFMKWMSTQLVYPEQAKKDTIQGKVIAQFIVSEKGKVENVKILRGVSDLLDKEAYRVISQSPQWEPAIKDGKPVKVVYTFPVVFKLR